jgi:glycosyltransferase involved in cell wall biosynthesis
MAQGRIVAASDVGGHRELVTDGLTGALFVADDPAACADKLAALLEARGSWDAMRNAGRAHVAAHHDWSRNVRRYQDVYQPLLGRMQTGRNRVAA